MVSTGWFIICAPCFVTAFFTGICSIALMCDISYHTISKKCCLYGFIPSMILGMFCIAMGFRAPDKMPVKAVEAVPSTEIIEQAVKKYIDSMTIDQKYDIIAKKSIH